MSASPTQQQQSSQQQQGGGGGGGSSAASLLLDGDGILTQLFYFLWRMKCSAVQAAGGGSTTTGTYNPLKPPKSDDPAIQACMDLCIPSTVILEHNFPKFWYARSADFEDEDPSFSSTRATIMNSAPPERRTGKDIDTASIIRALRAPEGGSGPVPGSGTNGSGSGGLAGSGADDGTNGANGLLGPGDVVASYYAEATDDEGRACTRVEFLDTDGVKSLLIRRTRRPDGILQCFVSPCGKQNSVVQVVWSPHVVHVTRRRNRFPLRDTRLPLYDRCTTFEGLAHYSDEVFVAPHVRLQANLVCEELVRGFREVHRVMVQRMVLYFKPDSAGRLWFLFGNSLRVADRIPLRLSERKPVALSLRGVKPQERQEAEQHQTSRLARMLVDEAYEVKAAHEENSKMQEYYEAHKKLQQAAKEEPLIRALVGTPLAPYARYRPKPPSLGPIGDTYNPAPRPHSSAAAAGALAADGGLHQQTGGDGDNVDDDGDAASAPFSPTASTRAGAGDDGAGSASGGPSPPPPHRQRSAGANLNKLVSKIRTATMLGGQSTLSPPEKRLLSSPLSCVVPPLYGTGTLRGSSLSMFGSTTAADNNNNAKTSSGSDVLSPFSPSSSLFLGGGLLTSQQLQQYSGRNGVLLWQVARLAVFSGAIRTVALRVELREFIKSAMYSLYSHFSAEAVLASKISAAALKGAPATQRPFRIVVPLTYFQALGECWWEELGFSGVRLVKVSEVAVLVPPPAPPRNRKGKNKKDSMMPEQQGRSESPAGAEDGRGGGGDEERADDADDEPDPQQQHEQQQAFTPVQSRSPARNDQQQQQQQPDNESVGITQPSILAGGENGGAKRSLSPSSPEQQQQQPEEEGRTDADGEQEEETDPHRIALRHFTQEQIDERAKRMLRIPLTASPDDIVLEVAGLAAPLLHVQTKVENLLRRRIDRPAAKIRFFYAAHRVILDRRKARNFASVVRQTWIQHKAAQKDLM